MHVLILGAGGMLGHTLLSELSRYSGFELSGTVRSRDALKELLPAVDMVRLHSGIDACRFETIAELVRRIRPDVLINCIGLIRQKPEGQQPLPCIEINARLPHLLLALCREEGIRLIHYSTDCVFDGHKGAPYTEEDPPSAKDIYGLTKYLGEVKDAPALTIRTSIIGHELKGKRSLVEWFLAQEGTVDGYTKALYTGLPTCEHARILAEYILPRRDLGGLFHVAATSISKYDLLTCIADVYAKRIAIRPAEAVREDKRLCGAKFEAATGYRAPEWQELVARMFQSHARF